MTKKLAEKFKRVKLLISDVDGVLTKGEIVYDTKGNELKIFNVKDGLGVFLLSKIGLPTVLLTARDSGVVKKRAGDMGVSEVIGGILPKVKVIEDIKKRYGVSEKEICFLGDDLIDIGVMKKVGVPVAVGDAPPEVKRAAVYVTGLKGGHGAVREVAEAILKAKRLWSKLVKDLDHILYG